MLVQLTRKSGNKKTGPIPVSTTEAKSCPDSCPLKSGGCYAKHGPLRFNWDKVAARGVKWSQFCHDVSQLPKGQLWRHNQAGDLPGIGDELDREALSELVAANAGRKGFTYTHKPMTRENRAAVADANLRGFTVNVSYNSLEELDNGVAGYSIPAVVVLEADAVKRKVTRTAKGLKVVTCPATYRDDLDCAKCGLCYDSSRQYVIGFPVHGNGAKKAAKVAEGKES